MPKNIFSEIIGKEDGYFCDDFEHRPQQIQMADAVENAISTQRHSIVEAGTGVGKSLAYLLPLVKWTTSRGKKAVVSTYTKTLQEQLFNKDLPFFQKILGTEFRFVLCLGSENYVCMRRFHQNRQDFFFETEREKEENPLLHKWFLKTQTGLRSELDFIPRDSLWNKVRRESELCMGKTCLFRKQCFYHKAKKEEYRSHILLTNHHLFFSHLASGNKVLPRFDTVVFDEAHTLEDVATSFLGMKVSNIQINFFIESLFNPQTQKGFLTRLKGISSKERQNAKEILSEAATAAQLFFSDVALRFGGETKTVRLKEKDFVFNHLREPFLTLVSALKGMTKNVKTDDDRIEIESFMSRAKKFVLTMDVIIRMEMEKYVYWLEILNRPRGIRYEFFAAPIDISREFKKRVLDEVKPAIFVSATLSSNGNFEFLKQRLGLSGEIQELILDSPFDYAKNALLYLPNDMPDPAQKPSLYHEMVFKEIKNILDILKGRTFVLFTSFRMMDEICAGLKRDCVDLHILKQGDAPRYKLLEIFKSKNNAVLLGTNTFWQGIDIPGRALECVIIAKLPFAVPDEPIVEGKMEALVMDGKDPFVHYQLPQAVIMLRQGFGRLIRTQKDRGMVAILDPRIRTRRYGKDFISSLPVCRHISDLRAAEKFFHNDNATYAEKL